MQVLYVVTSIAGQTAVHFCIILAKLHWIESVQENKHYSEMEYYSPIVHNGNQKLKHQIIWHENKTNTQGLRA